MPAGHRLLLPAALTLLLSGCASAAAPAPAVTVTVTATPAVATPQPGEAAPWDLHGVCAAESEVSTLIVWRDQQREAGRLTASQSAAVLQGVAVQYLEFDQAGLPRAVRPAVTALAHAAGTLERPGIDLESGTVLRARHTLSEVCQRNGLTIGVIAQGG